MVISSRQIVETIQYISCMKQGSKKKPKPRADKYDEKVKFDGTFEQMVQISVKQAEKKKKQ